MTRAAVLLACFALCGFALWPVLRFGPAAAQQPAELAIEVVGGGDRLAVGDPIVIRVEVRHAEDARVELDSAMTELGPLDAALPELETVEPSLTVVVWRTAAFQVGVFEFQLPLIAVVRGEQRQSLAAPLQRVEIVSSLPGDAVEPRPLTPPQELEGGSGFAFWIAALLAVAGGFLLARVLGVRARRRGGRAGAPDTQTRGPPPLPELAAGANAAEFCAALAAAVRAHLAHRYQIPAQSLTSAELPQQLAAAGAPAAAVQRVRTLLRECDAATFADHTPPSARLDGYRQLAVAIIDEQAVADTSADTTADTIADRAPAQRAEGS